MATSTPTVNPLLQAMQLIQNKSEEEQRQMWSEALAAQQTPRSMPSDGWTTSYQEASLEPQPMDRCPTIQSAPPTMMSREQSWFPVPNVQLRTYSQGSTPPTTYMQKPSVTIDNWHASSEDHFNLINAKNVNRSPRNWVSSLPQVEEVEATFEDPAAYIKRNNLDNNATASRTTVPCASDISPPSPQDSSLLSVSTNYTWNSSPECTPYPTTPPSSGLTPASTHNLSRQSSISHSVIDELGLMRIHSTRSHVSDPVAAEETFLLSSSAPPSNFVSSQCESIVQTDDGFTSLISFPIHSFSSQEGTDMKAACMQREESNESVSSNHSSSSAVGSRSQRVHREQLARATKLLAPKTDPNTDDTSSPSSEAGATYDDHTLKLKVPLIKAPYVRPTHPKLFCPYCEKQPEGFRGEHELRRHTERAHPQGVTKKVWVTVDASPNKKFLSNCKACTAGKHYGAYYNAAAHLRRTHFHPRKRGRRAKGDEKRGGKGGGDDPPMEHLKEFWLKEIEVPVGSKYTNLPKEEDDDDIEAGSPVSDNGTDSPDTVVSHHPFVSTMEGTPINMPIDTCFENVADMAPLHPIDGTMFPLGNYIPNSEGYLLGDPALFSFDTQEMLQLHCNVSSANAVFPGYDAPFM